MENVRKYIGTCQNSGIRVVPEKNRHSELALEIGKASCVSNTKRLNLFMARDGLTNQIFLHKQSSSQLDAEAKLGKEEQRLVIIDLLLVNPKISMGDAPEEVPAN
ncbi:MAG: hypothetical protein AAF399_21555 [Bacteroidota bacterium]